MSLNHAIIHSASCFVNNVYQPALCGYQLSEAIDAVTNTGTIDFSSDLTTASGLIRDWVQVYEANGVTGGSAVLVYSGFVTTGTADRSPTYTNRLETWGWLGLLQNNQLDARGIALGASLNNDGTLSALGVSTDLALTYVLELGGVPSASINIASTPYTGVSAYGPSATYLLASVIPYWAQDVSFFDVCTDILSYNGWQVYEGPDGQIYWTFWSPTPSASPSYTYSEGETTYYGYRNLLYSRNDQYTFNRVEFTGVDVSGIAQCEYVYAIKQGQSVKELNGIRVVPDNPLNVNDPGPWGYSTYAYQSNIVDVVNMAVYAAQRIYSETNNINEEISFDAIPNPYLKLGMTIAISGCTQYKGLPNGNWVVKQIDRAFSKDDKPITTITCNRGNFGGSRYS